MLAARDRRRRGRGLESEATAARRALVDAVVVVALLFVRPTTAGCSRTTAGRVIGTSVISPCYSPSRSSRKTRGRPT